MSGRALEVLPRRHAPQQESCGTIHLVRRVEAQREAKLREEGVWFEDEDFEEDDADAPAKDG